MAIDMEALARITLGDPEAKISVKRKWLAEVYRQLNTLQDENQNLKNQVAKLENSDIQHETPFGMTPDKTVNDWLKGKFKGRFDF